MIQSFILQRLAWTWTDAFICEDVEGAEKLSGVSTFWNFLFLGEVSASMISISAFLTNLMCITLKLGKDIRKHTFLIYAIVSYTGVPSYTQVYFCAFPSTSALRLLNVSYLFHT